MSVVKTKRAGADAEHSGRSTVEDSVRYSADAAQRGFEQAASITREHLDKASQTLFKNYAEISQFGMENVDAFVKSGTIFAKGFEEVSKSWMALTRRSFESGVETAKAVLGARNLRDVVDLQSEFARTSFDNFMSEGTRIGELSVKVTNEALEPIQSRVNLAVEKLLKPVAV
jgi:phasin family protein